MRQSPKLKDACLIAAFLGAGAAIAQQPGGEMPPTPVTVVTLHTEDVTLTSKLPGRVVASAEAELRPQVSGIITERLYEEGSNVTEGQALYRIDPRTYEAAVAQAQASLVQAEAQAQAANNDAERVAALRDRRVASEQTQDSAIAQRDAANAAVRAAQAQLQVAQLDLDRTTITAPLSGVIGLAQTSQGALVTASQATPLAVIRRIDPVRVDVTQPAAEIVRWKRQGDRIALPEGIDRTVTLQLADGTFYENTGSITAAEPHVNETTGLVTLRMEFSNPDGMLLPGMFVLADIPQAELRDVVLAPQEGVVRDRRGRPIGFVVNADNVVEERQLDIVQDRGNQWVVREGLADGDRLIVAGFQRIGAGMTVAPEERQTEAADEGTPENRDGATQASAEAPDAEQHAAPAAETEATDARATEYEDSSGATN